MAFETEKAEVELKKIAFTDEQHTFLKELLAETIDELKNKIISNARWGHMSDVEHQGKKLDKLEKLQSLVRWGS